MIKVSKVLRKEGENGPFVLLELQGGLELVQSQKTGLFYGTVRKCTITCTEDYETAQQFIGQQLPGKIEKVECAPYQYIVPESGEVLDLTHQWQYVPEKPVVEMRITEVGLSAA